MPENPFDYIDSPKLIVAVNTILFLSGFLVGLLLDHL